jgi:hypothetical protein
MKGRNSLFLSVSGVVKKVVDLFLILIGEDFDPCDSALEAAEIFC